MTRRHPLRLVLSAGETSGDQIAADLARALRRHQPDIELAGLAGPRMVEAGVEPWIDIDQLQIMGLTEVLRHLPRLMRLRRDFRQRILAWPADAFIGVDAPDFNLGLAARLRGHGPLAIHYVSPSVWAWRAHRIKRISRSLDLLLTLFPFEQPLYEPQGLDARFVGHHLADELKHQPGRKASREAMGASEANPLIVLLPGSRPGELRRHAAVLAETARRLRHDYPEARLQLLLAQADHQPLMDSLVGSALAESGVQTCIGQTRTGLAGADLAIAASGTVTLEAFLLGCPLVVFYRLAPGTFWLARSLSLVKSRFISLPNILCQDALVPERIQDQANAIQLSRDARDWLEQPERVTHYRRLARQWAGELACQAGDRAAEAILERLMARPATQAS
ncbi:MAG: lipid-A-disaccharide synthase [Wenzhouxiangella sp.]